ncbi:hypothetical protein COCNU_scaffold025359G000010 [Cocos nucifera]|nr:hypothetical protein [Cocos nucifera]
MDHRRLPSPVHHHRIGCTTTRSMLPGRLLKLPLCTCITAAGSNLCSRATIRSKHLHIGFFPGACSDTRSMLPGAKNPLHEFLIAPATSLGRNLGDKTPLLNHRIPIGGIDAGIARKGKI